MSSRTPLNSRGFGEYWPTDARRFVTTQDRVFYPDYLADATEMYEPVLVRFGSLAYQAMDSEQLLRALFAEPTKMRGQLLRVFRKYVSPTTSVEMLKRPAKIDEVIADFGAEFRPIALVRDALRSRPSPDEALAAILWEHHDRGTPGYELTQTFFRKFRDRFGERFIIDGPERAGKDIQLQAVLPKFLGVVPADFLILRKEDLTPLVVGFAHYDSDRGGSQEDDRTSGNQDKVNKIMEYASRRRVQLKVLFVNDGPGLLLGSMWRDYAKLETANVVDEELRVMVITLKMFDDRLTASWMTSKG